MSGQEFAIVAQRPAFRGGETGGEGRREQNGDCPESELHGNVPGGIGGGARIMFDGCHAGQRVAGGRPVRADTISAR